MFFLFFVFFTSFTASSQSLFPIGMGHKFSVKSNVSAFNCGNSKFSLIYSKSYTTWPPPTRLTCSTTTPHPAPFAPLMTTSSHPPVGPSSKRVGTELSPLLPPPSRTHFHYMSATALTSPLSKLFWRLTVSKLISMFNFSLLFLLPVSFTCLFLSSLLYSVFVFQESIQVVLLHQHASDMYKQINGLKCTT